MVKTFPNSFLTSCVSPKLLNTGCDDFNFFDLIGTMRAAIPLFRITAKVLLSNNHLNQIASNFQNARLCLWNSVHSIRRFSDTTSSGPSLADALGISKKPKEEDTTGPTIVYQKFKEMNKLSDDEWNLVKVI